MNKTPMEGKFAGLVEKYERKVYLADLRKHDAYLLFKQGMKQLLSEVTSAGSLRQQAGATPSKLGKRVQTAPERSKPVKSEVAQPSSPVESTEFTRVPVYWIISALDKHHALTAEKLVGQVNAWHESAVCSATDVMTVCGHLKGIVNRDRDGHYYLTKKGLTFDYPSFSILEHVFKSHKGHRVKMTDLIGNDLPLDRAGNPITEYTELEWWIGIQTYPKRFMFKQSYWYLVD